MGLSISTCAPIHMARSLSVSLIGRSAARRGTTIIRTWIRTSLPSSYVAQRHRLSHSIRPTNHLANRLMVPEAMGTNILRSTTDLITNRRIRWVLRQHRMVPQHRPVGSQIWSVFWRSLVTLTVLLCSSLWQPFRPASKLLSRERSHRTPSLSTSTPFSAVSMEAH